MVVPLARLGALFSFKADGDTPGPKAVARMQAVAPERLLLESDLYLSGSGTETTVQRHRLERVAAQLAAATGMTPAQAASLTAENARRCLGI
jgi:Tat protein secretion system quality control protein TatD with DNase activity